ncbi:hypothetical protein BCT07_09665 [Vibrio breoganii]|nr:hypothetical protein BCT07_09665 [Vibrio breoganii]
MRSIVRKIISWLVYLKVKISNPATILGKGCRINWTVSFCGTKPITIGRQCSLRNYAVLSPGHGSISIGNNSAIGAFNYFDGNGGIEVGNDVRFGPHCAVYSANHTFADIDHTIASQPLDYAKVIIEDDVWVGSHSVILAGVRIGTGTVISAGSIVTKDVEPYCVVAGVPAKVIKRRK